MKKKIFFFLFFLIFSFPLNAEIKNKIISNLNKTNNLFFDFEQRINDKTEKGNCIIEYPKKIFCSYNNFNKKIMVSDGKSLVIKNIVNNQYYKYSLKKTPLELILDKKFLIKKIRDSKIRIIDNKYINFTLKNNNYKINIFFDKKSLNLIGWQTEDIYKNLVITFISSVKINQIIKKNTFKVPVLEF